MKPRYNPSTKQFECFCKIDALFESLQKFKLHSKTKKHQEWIQTFFETRDTGPSATTGTSTNQNSMSNGIAIAAEAEIEAPICVHCFDVMDCPRLHEETCFFKHLMHEQVSSQFEEKLK